MGGSSLDANGKAIAGSGWAGAGIFSDSSARTLLFGSISGGTAASLTGGNFWQGAATSVIISSLNHFGHKSTTYRGVITLEEDMQTYTAQQKIYYEYDTSMSGGDRFKITDLTFDNIGAGISEIDIASNVSEMNQQISSNYNQYNSNAENKILFGEQFNFDFTIRYNLIAKQLPLRLGESRLTFSMSVNMESRGNQLYSSLFFGASKAEGWRFTAIATGTDMTNAKPDFYSNKFY